MIEFLMAVRKRIILIILITAVGTGFALFKAFFSERAYEGKVTLLIYQDESSDIIVGMFKDILWLASGSSYVFSEVLNSIAKSDTLTDGVVRKLNLENDPEFREKLPEKLRGNRNAFVDAFKQGLIVEVLQPRVFLKYTASTPEKAAAIANAYADGLKAFLQEMKNENYKFYLKDFDKNKKELEQIEDQIKKFEEKNKVVALDEQLKQQVENLSQLTTRMGQLEGQAAQFKEIINTSADPLKISQARAQLKSANTEMSEIKTQLDSIQNSAEELPEQKLEYFRLKRDLEKKEMYVAGLERQLIALRLKLEQNLGQFIIIDRAYPPFYPSAPQRRKIVLFGFAGSLFFALFLALFLDLYNRQLEQYLKKDSAA